jgi:uncharacterized protein YkwD
MRRLTLIGLCVAAMAGPVSASTAEMESQVLAMINVHRTAAGCQALALNGQLQAAAEGHARAMAVQNFFSHTGKNGSKLKGRVRAAGYTGGRLAENIANGQKSAAAVVAAWMGSKGHVRNIMNCAYKDTGIALVYQADDDPLPGKSYAPRYYWVQDFGQQ